MAYSKHKKELTLNLADLVGVQLAADHMKISPRTIFRWYSKDPKRSYSKISLRKEASQLPVTIPVSYHSKRYNALKKLSIIEFARDHGVQAAVDQYGVSRATIYRWLNE